MRILIATTRVPFAGPPPNARPGLAEGLRDALSVAGHQGEIVRMPFAADSERLLEQVVAARLKDLRGFDADLLVALDFPAFLIRHPKKVLWLREPLPAPAGATDVVAAEARCALGESAAAFAASAEVADALPGMGVKVLAVPEGEGWSGVVEALLAPLAAEDQAPAETPPAPAGTAESDEPTDLEVELWSYRREYVRAVEGLADRDAEIGRVQEHARGLEAHIQELTEHIQELTEHFQGLTDYSRKLAQEIRDKDAEIERRGAALAELQERLAAAEAELALTFMDRLRRKLATLRGAR